MRLIGRAVDRFEPRGLPLTAARTTLATAHLAILAANPDSALFVGTVEAPDGLRCEGLSAAALWCLTGPTDAGMLLARTIAVVVLALVLSGYRPRWTCIPHWYVAFGLATSMPMANGGDRIAQLATMLLIPLCLGDDRRWQWSHPASPLAPTWRGSALAAQLALRGQLVVIYTYAAVSKLSDPAWRQGSAMYVIANDPRFGPPPLLPWPDSYWVSATITWSAITVQLVIAVALLSGVRGRRVAFLLGTALHAAIALVLSLPVFSMVMIGALVAGCAPFAAELGTKGVRGDGPRGAAIRPGTSR